MRMAHDVVRRADQFLFGEAADLDEDVVGEFDAPTGKSSSRSLIGSLTRMQGPSLGRQGTAAEAAGRRTDAGNPRMIENR